MKTGIPVVGKTPYMVSDWITEKNGVWVENPLQLVDVIADVVQTWLEDNILVDLYTEGEKTAEKYTNKEKFDTDVMEIFTSFITKRKEAFEAQIQPETV